MEKAKALDLVTEVMQANFTEAQKKSWAREAQGMPLLEGETYHLKEITKDNVHVGKIGAGSANAGDKYLQFETEEGTMLGIAQIARKNNGLGLTGGTRAELVADFVCKVNTYNETHPDSEGYPFKVNKLKTRPGQGGQMVVPTFELIEE